VKKPLPANVSAAIYLRLLKHVKPYWKAFAGGLFFIVVLALTEPAIPWLLKPLLDGTFVERDPEYLFWSPILLLALFLVRGGSNFLSRVAFQWVGGKVVLDLRNRMFDRLLSLPTSYFDAHATGNLIAKLTYDVTQVTTAATRVLTVLVRDSISVLGLLVYMLWLNWQFTLIVFLLLPVMLGFVRFISARMRRESRNVQHIMGEMFIGAVMIAILIYAGTGQAGGEPMSVGEFVSYFAALGMLFAPIKRLTAINQPLQTGLAGAESVFELIDQEPENDTGNRELGAVKGHIRFEDVHFRYPQAESDALRGVTFEVQPGHTVALVGPSGSGKTTIAALIPRFYEVTAGQIHLDDIPLQEITLRSLRDQIAYVGQESVLFNDTVAANIAYGMKEPPSREALEAAAEAAHALEFIRQLPEGFDTLVGEDGIRLSGGQRQRIAIARALLKNAPILVLDEATSALDTASERHVQAALANLTADRTTIVIAHRLSTIEHADEILVIRDGRIVESGAHAELIERNGEYARLYNIQIIHQEPAGHA